MTISPVCPKCLKIAFDYYVGNDVDLEKQDVVFARPKACTSCGYKMKKIKKGSGSLRLDNPRMAKIEFSSTVVASNWCAACYPKFQQSEFIFQGFSLCRACFKEKKKMTEEILRK